MQLKRKWHVYRPVRQKAAAKKKESRPMQGYFMLPFNGLKIYQ
jgi:hypothetical protein